MGLPLPAALVLLWQLLCTHGVFPSDLLPAPSKVFETIGSMVWTGSLWMHVSATCVRVALGFVCGGAAGVLAGCVIGLVEKLEWMVDPIIQALRSVPSLAWVPLFILWFGIGESSKVGLIAVGVFFPVYLNTLAGIRYVDRKLLEVGKVFHFSKWELTRRITLWYSLPSIFTGLRSGLGLGWMFVVAAELMGASQGLGYMLQEGQDTYAPDLIVGSILLFAIFGKTSDALLRMAERRALHWHDNPLNQLHVLRPELLTAEKTRSEGNE